MSRILAVFAIAISLSGCASRPGWGFNFGSKTIPGTTDRQKSRAVVHDPYTLNDIGPEVVGGRPRDFMTPQAEARRQHDPNRLPQNWSYVAPR